MDNDKGGLALILEATANLLDEASWRLMDEYNSVVGYDNPRHVLRESARCTRALLSMCLVNKAWVAPAQSALGRHLKLHSSSSAKNYLRSKQNNATVRGISFVFNPLEQTDGAETYWAVLSTLLARCPNLRHLSVKSNFRFCSDDEGAEDQYVEEFNGLGEVFNGIGRLSSLRSLVFAVDLHVERPECHPLHLCRAISQLPHLSSLHISLWTGASDGDHANANFQRGIVDALAPHSPPATLKNVVILVLGSSISWPCLTWFMRKDDNYQPETMALSFVDVMEPTIVPAYEIAKLADNSISSLQSLVMTCNGLVFNHDEPLAVLLASKSPNLKVLELPVGEDVAAEDFPVLPRSLQVLRICIGAEDYKGVDKALSRFLEGSKPSFKNLRSLEIRGYQSNFPVVELLPRTKKVCRQAGLPLSVSAR